MNDSRCCSGSGRGFLAHRDPIDDTVQSACAAAQASRILDFRAIAQLLSRGMLQGPGRPNAAIH